MRRLDHRHQALAHINDDDRTVALVFPAAVEEAINSITLRKLRDDDRKELEALVGLSGPLGSFIPMARLAYLLGIFDKPVLHDLKLIAKVRNHFAHRINAGSFEDEPVRSWSAELTQVDRLAIAPGSGSLGQAFTPEEALDMYRFEVDLVALRQQKLRFAVGCIALAEWLAQREAIEAAMRENPSTTMFRYAGGGYVNL